ncbi:hypothetical protein C3747_40g31 [Trypanosoma cruzi]|uniref:Uncharacterized protein n=2 Tax=Trypanosoma cruzi TaxID=5693 RepID=Q4DIW4_TRYCC|nr:hypothetical protein, conserved [Trypanosoma cruzi]EAN92452.1 hypothetical protein, conserved [Trypanosoma cruzi]PWV13910.1 hypothetical protein C3747_40g31 [Trypanosoma cruzi]RNC59597.1 hypothetical protein TcCL_ESM02800 [Trypanosoma cruzi]|eukprot:XP_814303.1 hypothetical protein [Trypanosoma cruzi strain CL Brener]
MSLFDDDSVSSSSSGCDDKGRMGGNEFLCASVKRELVHKNGAGGTVNLALGDGVSRFTLTIEENRQADERRRREAASRSRLHGAQNAEADGGKSVPGESRFYASMAEALQVRRDAREALFLQRIQKRRQEEAGNSELVEKDLEVGVFVTPQYLAALKRQKHLSVDASHVRAGIDTAGSVEVTDPLEVYVRQLEEKRLNAAPHFSSTVSAVGAVTADGCSQNEAKAIAPAAQENPRLNVGIDVLLERGNYDSTTHTVLSSSIETPTTVASLPDESSINVRGDDNISRSLPSFFVPLETVSPEDVIRMARESRKRHRADRHFMTAAADRFNVRALEGIGTG